MQRKTHKHVSKRPSVLAVGLAVHTRISDGGESGWGIE